MVVGESQPLRFIVVIGLMVDVDVEDASMNMALF